MCRKPRSSELKTEIFGGSDELWETGASPRTARADRSTICPRQRKESPKKTKPSLGLSHIMEEPMSRAEANPASGTRQPSAGRGNGQESSDLGYIYSAVSILSLSQRKSQGQFPSGSESGLGNKSLALPGRRGSCSPTRPGAERRNPGGTLRSFHFKEVSPHPGFISY